MTSHRQRLQPDHRIESYACPTGVFDDDFGAGVNDFFVDGASSSNDGGARQSIFECDTYVDSHYRDCFFLFCFKFAIINESNCFGWVCGIFLLLFLLLFSSFEWTFSFMFYLFSFCLCFAVPTVK